MGATHESEEGDRAAANRTEQRRNEVLIAELIYSLLLRGQRGDLLATHLWAVKESDNLAAVHPFLLFLERIMIDNCTEVCKIIKRN